MDQLQNLWSAEELQSNDCDNHPLKQNTLEDDCLIYAKPRDVETLSLLLVRPDCTKTQRISYQRSPKTIEWTRIETKSQTDALISPTRISVCPQKELPVRTAKVHTQFRRHLLEAMLDTQRILCNMVLFHCTACNERYPTFHPKSYSYNLFFGKPFT